MTSAPLRIGPLGPLAPDEDTHVLVRSDGRWLVSARTTSPGSPLRLSDANPCGKVQVFGDPASTFASDLGVELGRAELFAGGVLIASPAPGEWLALAPSDGIALHALLHGLGASEDVVVVERSAGLAAFRLTGGRAPDVLAAAGSAAWLAPGLVDGGVRRGPLAGVRTTVIRDDLWPEQLAADEDEVGPDAALVTSYLLVCDRSLARVLHAALLGAGGPLGIETEGYAGYRAYHHDV